MNTTTRALVACAALATFPPFASAFPSSPPSHVAPASVEPAADDMSGHMAMETITVGDLEISAPFIRATPPRAPVSGGYMIIRNTGDADDRLLGGSVDFARKVEVHEMKMDGDVMRMRELENGLVIPAGGEVTLKPGGFHVMFMQLEERMVTGETRTVTLEFERAGTVDLDMPVRDVTRGGHAGHGG